MLNKVIIMGRLTADPDLRQTDSGTPVASFTLAVDRDYKDRDGNRQTDFVSCVAWRGTAEFVSKYFSKGSMAAVSGSLQSRKWTDKEDHKRISWEVIADSIYFTGERRSDMAAAPAAYEAYAAVDIPEDELQF